MSLSSVRRVLVTTALATPLSGKADAADVVALDARVDAVETGLATKADASALAAETAARETDVEALDNSIAGAVTGLAAIINDLAEYTDGVDAVAQGTRLTAGAKPLIYSIGEMFNGAVAIAGPAGGSNRVGYTSPAGAAIQPTYVTSRITFSDEERAALTGRKIRIKGVAQATAGFLTDRTLDDDAVNINTVSEGFRGAQGVVVRNEQVGTLLYREATYDVVGDEFFAGLVWQIKSDSGTANNHQLEVIATTWAIESVPDGNVETAADEMLAKKLSASGIAEVLEVVEAKRFGFVNDLSEVTPSVQPFNGASALVGDDGRNWGWTVPVGSSGTTTLLQILLDLRGFGYLLAGRTVRVNFGMDTSDDYTQFGGPTFSVRRAGDGSDTFLGTTTTTFEQVSTNRRLWSFQAVMNGTETILKPFFRRGTQPLVTGSEQYILVTDVTLEIVASPSDALTLQEENLRLGNLLRQAAMEASVSDQISAAILGTDAEVITVGPTGSDFTTLSAAIDAITDSGPSKQYKICWKAGTTLGSPNRTVPPWTSIIAADRNEDAVISYALPTDALATTITNTQLLWLYENESVVEGGTWLLENGRYPFHPESGADYPSTRQRMINVVAKHLGNLTAVNNTWNIGSQFAIGCGMSEGQLLEIIDCDLEGPAGGFSTHGPNGGTPWLLPWINTLQNTRCVATNPGSTGSPTSAVRLVSLAVGPGRVILSNSEFAKLRLTDNAWIGGTPASDVNTAQIDIIAASCAPFEFVNSITLGDPAGADYLPLIINPGA